MRIQMFVTLALIASLMTSAESAAADVIFRDGFETGDRSSSTNGFVWSRTGDRVYVSSDTARTGTHSLCFFYLGKPSGEDSTAEQRFKLGAPRTEIWMQFWVKIPKNYYHRDDSPSNNKFITLWSKDYTDYGNSVIIGLWSDTHWDNVLKARVTDTGNTVVNWGSVGPPKGPSDSTLFIDRATDLGKWIEVTFHWKLASGKGANDGVVELWKGDEDGRRQLFSRHDVPNWGPDDGKDPAYNFLDQGYLFGWANSGFSNDTYFYVDDFTVSTSPLIPIPVAPKSPTKVIAN